MDCNIYIIKDNSVYALTTNRGVSMHKEVMITYKLVELLAVIRAYNHNGLLKI